MLSVHALIKTAPCINRVRANQDSFQLPIAGRGKGDKNTENAINSKLQS